jgi:hypothetical protein
MSPHQGDNIKMEGSVNVHLAMQRQVDKVQPRALRTSGIRTGTHSGASLEAMSACHQAGK